MNRRLNLDCARCRDAISARLDGEDPGVAAGRIDEHLETCPACMGFATDAESLHRVVRIAPADPVPDLTPRILHAIGEAEPMRRRERVLRGGLAAVAIVQIMLAVPALLLGDDAGLPVHAARHLGSFDVALAIGFLFAAWRPSQVRGLLPVATALVACVVATSTLDIVERHAALLSETHHVPELLGLVFSYLLVHPLGSRRSQLSPV